MGVFLKMIENFRIDILIKHLWIAAFEFTDNSHSFYPFLSIILVCRNKEEGRRGSQSRIAN